MASHPIVSWFAGLTHLRPGLHTPDFHFLSVHRSRLPAFVRTCPITLRYLDLLGPLAWDQFPERNLVWQPAPVPFAAFAAACLIKLDQHLPSMGQLRRFLVEHPALTWALGFPLQPFTRRPSSPEVDASLPSARHLTRLLRTVPNARLQFLLDSSVQCIRQALPESVADFGQVVSMDTKHIVACVKHNNPKAYFKSGRFDKTQPPAGDPDCRLGCKRRHNRHKSNEDGQPADAQPQGDGEFYWGYASGVVATKVPGWGEFVLAELTLPFDQPDVAYFFPLMQQVEGRLGFRPHFGAFDAAYDAHYVYDYFHSDQHDGFAAVAYNPRGPKRSFDAQGLPLCPAGLSMPLKGTFIFQQTLFPHERGRYACPLQFPDQSAESCPVEDKHWNKGGCVVTMPTNAGARIRQQLDRESQTFKEIFKQRTATERINARAKHLGIERPNLRNGQAVANLNTLIYVLINLRSLQQILARKAEQTG